MTGTNADSATNSTEDIDYDEIEPGDIIQLNGRSKEWRVYEPVERRTTAMHSGLLIGCGIKGSPGLGGWKPARNITSHTPRDTSFETPENETQTQFSDLTA